MKRILSLGSVTTDIIVSPVDQLPERGTLKRVSSTTTHVGGCASNAAIDLGKLGAPVTLSCKLGDDSFGRFVHWEVARSGANCGGVIFTNAAATTSSVVLVGTDGERSFLYNPGSTSDYTPADIPESLLDDCDIVFVAGAMLLTAFDGEPCRDFLKRAKEKGKYTVMDTAWDFEEVWLPKIAPSLPFLDVFMPSFEEAARLSGSRSPSQMADFFQRNGAKNVIVKLGGDGAYFKEESGASYTLPTYDKVKPVDTTGAGDSFCAGFLYGLSAGWEFKRCGAFANAVGTHCIMAVGASTGMKPAEDILRFMEENPLS